MNQLVEHRVIRRSGPCRQWVFTFSRWSQSKAKDQLRQCRIVQARIDANDIGHKAVIDEGVYFAHRQQRDDQKKELAAQNRRNAKKIEGIARDGRKEDRYWHKREEQYRYDMYGDPKAPRARQPESPDSSGDESVQDGTGESASEPEVELPVPRRRRERQPAPRQPDAIGTRNPGTRVPGTDSVRLTTPLSSSAGLAFKPQLPMVVRTLDQVTLE
jgi:hypothetical protein